MFLTNIADCSRFDFRATIELLGHASSGMAAGASRNKWAGPDVLAVGLSMIVIDGTIAGISLPTIIADLDLNLNEAQWVNSLSSVVLAALLLTSGRVGDRFGRRRLFMLGVVLFFHPRYPASIPLSSARIGPPLLPSGVPSSPAWPPSVPYLAVG